MTTDHASATEPLGLGSSDGVGVAVLVDGAVVAWFAEMDDYAEEFCRENWFGRWMTWRAKRPEIVPLTPEELARCEAAAIELAARIQVVGDA